MQRNTRAGLARLWNWHPSRVTRLFQAPGAPRLTDGQIEVEEAEVWRDRRATERADGGHWRRELDRLKAVLLQIELDRVQAGQVSRADIEEQAKIDAALINGSLRAMPDTLAPLIVGLESVHAVQAVLNTWARSTLQSWCDAVTKGDQ